MFEAFPRFGVGGEMARKNLHRDVTSDSMIMRAVDLTHTARAERRDDLVRTEPGTDSQMQEPSISALDRAGGMRCGREYAPICTPEVHIERRVAKVWSEVTRDLTA